MGDFCSSVISEAAHLETLASHIHLHPRLRCLDLKMQRSMQSPLCQQPTVALQSNITFPFMRIGFRDWPIMTFRKGPIILPALQTLIWSTYLTRWTLFLPSLRYLSLINNPACVQSLEIGKKKVYEICHITWHRGHRQVRASPVPFTRPSPAIGALVEQPFYPNIPTLLLSYHPLQCLYLSRSSSNSRVEHVQRGLRLSEAPTADARQ